MAVALLTSSGVLLAMAALSSPAFGRTESAAAPQFSPHQDYPAGDRAQSVALGDLNGNGSIDVVTANRSVGTVSVLLNKGNGTLAARTAYRVGTGPWSVAVADLSGDGRLDIVATNYVSNSASVLINKGNGTFAEKVDFPTGPSPYSVALGDVTGDSRIDIVTANNGGANVSVLRNTGSGSFAPKVDYPTGAGPWSVVLGNIDDNPKKSLDIVTANIGDDTVSVLLNNGTGGFSARTDFPTGSKPVSVALGRVDPNSKGDIVTANSGDGTISLLVGLGNGTFRASVEFPAGRQLSAVSLSDLTGDGLADAVVSDFDSHAVQVLPNTKKASFGAGTAFATGTGPRSVALADLTGDRKSDIVTANMNANSVSVLLNATPLALSRAHDRLQITPPPSSVGTVLSYTIEYTTPQRREADRPWRTWARKWPADLLDIPLRKTRTVADCEDFAGGNTKCSRSLGRHDRGEVYLYRLWAHVRSVDDGMSLWFPTHPAVRVDRN